MTTSKPSKSSSSPKAHQARSWECACGERHYTEVKARHCSKCRVYLTLEQRDEHPPVRISG